MYGRWVQKGSYYKDRKVTHKHCADVVVIRSIQIATYLSIYNARPKIYLFPSIFHSSKVAALCNEVFGNAFEKGDAGQLAISITHPAFSKDKLIKLLRTLNNDNHDHTEFTDDFLKKIEDLLCFILEKTNEIDDLLFFILKNKTDRLEPTESDVIVSSSQYTNPDRENSTELVKYLQRRVDVSYKIVKKLLRSGIDPNAFDEDGNSALSESLFSGNLKIYRLCLYLKADPYRRPNTQFGDDLSVLELCKKYDATEAFSITLFALNKPQRHLQARSLKIIHTHVYSTTHEIITTMLCSNQHKIISILMTTEHLNATPNSKMKLAAKHLFDAYFPHRNPDYFASQIEHEPNKWVEIIIDQSENKVVGFFLFKTREEYGDVALYNEWGVVDEDSFIHRSGLATIWLRKYGLALVLLKPHTLVIPKCVLLEPLSAFNDLLSTMKYESAVMAKKNERFIDEEREYAKDPDFKVEDGCVISETLPKVSKRKKLSRAKTFEEQCFEEFIQEGNPNRKPVVAYVVGQSVVNDTAEIAARLGIDLKTHIEQLAACLKKNKSEFLPALELKASERNVPLELRESSFGNDRNLFWRGENTQRSTALTTPLPKAKM